MAIQPPSLRQQVLPQLRDLINEVTSIASRLRFDPNNRQHIISIALLGSILEQAQGISLALDHGNGTAAFILLRSALEAHIDLDNIADNPDYAEFMHAALLDQQRKTIQSANSRGASNPYLASMAGNQAIDQHLAWLKSELTALKSRGVEPLTIKKKFEMAGKLDLYEGPYALLCSHTHNNLSVLEERHLTNGPNGFEVRYFSPPDDTDTQLVVDTLAGVIANSAATTKDTVEGGGLQGLDDLTRKIEALRAHWKPSPPNPGPQPDVTAGAVPHG